MNQQEAQAKITEAINADAEKVIAAAIVFNPGCRYAVEAARSVPGKVEGVAAVACRYALRGKDNAETIRNMITFAELL